MKRDLLQQAYGAMRHDLRKTVLTMLGMAWGIATVVLLLAYGEGFGTAIENIFQSFGATSVGIFPGRTSQQAGGNKAGVQIRFTDEDIELVRNVVPLVRHVSRQSDKQCTVQSGPRSFSFPVIGDDATIQDILNLQMDAGRFFNDQDSLSHSLVAVIGSEAKSKLFSGMPAVGESLRINGISFQIIGVLHPQMQEGDDDNKRTVYIPYSSMDVIQDTHFLGGIWLDSQGLDHGRLTKTIRDALATAHGFKPDDERAVFIFDAQKQLSQFGIISIGLKILLTFIGKITLSIDRVWLVSCWSR
jgi:putative ABC transport system permease protein